MHDIANSPLPAPERTRVLTVLVAAAVAVGLAAAMDPTTLRPGVWTTTFFAMMGAVAAAGVVLVATGQRWSDPALGLLVSCFLGFVVISVLANQQRAGGMLNVVLMLPLTVYAAVYLSAQVCRVTMAVMVLCVALIMSGVAGSAGQWATLTAIPAAAFLATTEVVLRLRLGWSRALAALRLQAFTDPLTGLLNRRGLTSRLDDRVGDVSGGATGIATVLVLDVDHFKSVNDTLGHDAGDEVLRCFAAGLAAETRREDVVVRMGGEEFAVLSPTAAEHAWDLAETLRARAAVWMAQWAVTVSVGMLTDDRSTRAGFTREELAEALTAADACLYSAKQQGRNRTVMTRWTQESAAPDVEAVLGGADREHP